MNSSLTAEDFSERFSTALTTLLNNWIKRWLSPNADNTVLGLITWADLGVMLCLVLLVLVKPIKRLMGGVN